MMRDPLLVYSLNSSIAHSWHDSQNLEIRQDFGLSL